MSWLIGIDAGGTFTDFYASDLDSGAVRLFKTTSTPANPGAAIVEGLAEMCRTFDIPAAAIRRISHGTTVATNALIQRKGGKVALITTEGFRDLLEIGRQTRPHLYDLQADHPAPLVPRRRRFEVAERMTAEGTALKELDEASAEAAVTRALDTDAAACAVCLLFAYLNDGHEKRIAELVRERNPSLPVSLSSEVQPEFREYERFSTTVLNAYLQPVMGEYLGFLEEALARDASDAVLGIYQSSGGLMSAERARRFPVRTALSGPAAGAVGAVHTSRATGRKNAITLDMGGTSADVALIRDFSVGRTFDRDIAGFPVRLPMVDINSVGAGGGSVAWFDRDGLLKVGPASAGADPGPACYGRGGTEPTVTDANLLLGRLSPAGLIGGRVALDPEAARGVFAPLAERLGCAIERAAHGVLGIVVANMVRAIRAVSVERGHDPRGCALVAFGGAGPLHAVDVARSLGIDEVIVPAAPGILCAEGLVVSELKEEFVRTARTRLDEEGLVRLTGIVETLCGAAESWFEDECVAPDRRLVSVVLDLRYVGQNFELAVPLDVAEPPDLPTLRERFFAVHTQHYGFHNPDDPIELINVRVTATGRLAAPPAAGATYSEDGVERVEDTREIWFGSTGPVATCVHRRAALTPGEAIEGPAIVEQLDSTTLLGPGDRLRIDDSYNLIVEVGR